MENHDTLYEQIKGAAQKAEGKEFPAMDKVWSRVEEKLDQKVLKKQNNRWKKIAAAASILLVVSLAYQFLKPKAFVAPQTEMVTKDSIETALPEIKTNENAVAAETIPNPEIKKNAAKVLKKQLENPASVAVEETKNEEVFVPPIAESEGLEKDKVLSEKAKESSSKKANLNAKGAGRWDDEQRNRVGNSFVSESALARNGDLQTGTKKADPLVVINGKPISSTPKKSAKDELAKLNADEIDSIIELKEPLYIINGNYYSEEEMFGARPTSPYAPLDKQEIETITILQGSEAIEKYGEKGKKGVVIITTKNRKPAVLQGK